MSRRLIDVRVAAAIVVGVGFAGAIVGAAAVRKKLTEEFEMELENQLAAAKRHYAVLYKRDQFSSPLTAGGEVLPTEAAALEAMNLYQGKVNTTEDGVQYETADFVATEYETGADDVEKQDYVGVQQVNVFEKEDALDIINDLWQKELANRTEDAPYILRVEEYLEDFEGYSKSELTYYAGDGVLADERDDTVDDLDGTVGLYNLERFGHWSNNPHTVYVRNPILQADFEVIRNNSKFAVLSGFGE